MNPGNWALFKTASGLCTLTNFVVNCKNWQEYFIDSEQITPQTCINTIYFAFVHPHLLFGVEMYANTGITHLSKLITLKNKILCILQNKTYSAPVKELYAHAACTTVA